MGFTSHQQVHGGPSGRIVGCSHFSHQHYGGRSARTTPPSHTPEIAPKWASGSTWFGKGPQESAGLSSCVLVAISPRRAKWGSGGVCPAGCARPTPLPADPRRWRTAGGGPVAGAQSAKVIVNHVGSTIPHVPCVYQQVSGYILA
jgi:hypothetical protein